MYLIDVAAFNPNRLALDDGLLDDCRLLDDWLLDDHRLLYNNRLLNHRRLLNHNSRASVDDCACDRPTDHTADEPRPEVATAAAPVAAVVMMVAMMPTVVVISAMPTPAMSMRERTGRDCRESDCYYEFLHCSSLSVLTNPNDISRYVVQSLVCRRTDQSADNRADCRSSERNPSDVPAAAMGVVNDMMPRRRRRTMRTMPPAMMRRGNRRASRQNHPSHENRECLDDLVHVTPATFCLVVFAGALLPLTESQETDLGESDNKTFFTEPCASR